MHLGIGLRLIVSSAARLPLTLEAKAVAGPLSSPRQRFASTCAFSSNRHTLVYCCHQRIPRPLQVVCGITRVTKKVWVVVTMVLQLETCKKGCGRRGRGRGRVCGRGRRRGRGHGHRADLPIRR